MGVAENRRQRRLWGIVGIAAVVLVAVWFLTVHDRRTAEASDGSSDSAAVVSFVAAPAPQTDSAWRAWPDTGPVTDAVTLVTASEPQKLIGLPAHIRGFTVQRVLGANRFTIGPADQQATVALPRNADASLLRPGQVVSVQGEVQRGPDGALFIAATAVEIQSGSGA